MSTFGLAVNRSSRGGKTRFAPFVPSIPLAFTPLAALTGNPPLIEEPREWGGPFDATGLMSMGVGYVGGACRGRNRGGRAVWDGARESGNCSCGGIVCDVCRSKSEVVVLVFDARQGSLLKDSPGLSVPGHTQSHEDGRAAGAKGGIWCEGGCPCSYPFLIAVGGQWWWPRSFLEMEIFAFLMFSTLARRDRPNKTNLQPEPEFRRSTCLVRGCIVIWTRGRQ